MRKTLIRIPKPYINPTMPENLAWIARVVRVQTLSPKL